MPKAARAWVGTAITLLLFAAHFFWPPAAGLCVLGVFFAIGAAFPLNIPSSRIAVVLAALLHAVALAHASGSVFLGLSVATLAIPALPNDVLVRRYGYNSIYSMPITLITAVGLIIAAWPVGWWVASVAPLVLWIGVGSTQVVPGLKAMKKFNRSSWRLKIGDPVPDFSLEDRRGDTQFRMSEQRGKHVLIAFMRGDWCPVCHVKMRVYQKEASNLAKHNVTLAIVSPSTGDKAVTFAKDAGLDMMILADPENKVATIFDAIEPKAHEGKDLPLPCSFLVDPEGKLAHASRPDDVASFLDPTAVLRLIDKRSSGMQSQPTKTQPAA